MYEKSLLFPSSTKSQQVRIQPVTGRNGKNNYERLAEVNAFMLSLNDEKCLDHTYDNIDAGDQLELGGGSGGKAMDVSDVHRVWMVRGCGHKK